MDKYRRKTPFFFSKVYPLLPKYEIATPEKYPKDFAGPVLKLLCKDKLYTVRSESTAAMPMKANLIFSLGILLISKNIVGRNLHQDSAPCPLQYILAHILRQSLNSP